MIKTTLAFLAAFSLTCAMAATNSVQVDNASVRATVPGQKATGAFMQITSKTAGQLVGASSPVANHVEIHEMKMQGEVMQMRAVHSLTLPAGQAVSLQPGGYHLMLLDLKKTLTSGSTVPVTLQIKDAQGKTQPVQLNVPVQ